MYLVESKQIMPQALEEARGVWYKREALLQCRGDLLGTCQILGVNLEYKCVSSAEGHTLSPKQPRRCYQPGITTQSSEELRAVRSAGQVPSSAQTPGRQWTPPHKQPWWDLSFRHGLLSVISSAPLPVCPTLPSTCSAPATCSSPLSHLGAQYLVVMWWRRPLQTQMCSNWPSCRPSG